MFPKCSTCFVALNLLSLSLSLSLSLLSKFTNYKLYKNCQRSANVAKNSAGTCRVSPAKSSRDGEQEKFCFKESAILRIEVPL